MMQHPESKSRTINLGLEKQLLNEIEAPEGLCWTLTQLVANAWLLPGWTLGVVESRSPVIYTLIYQRCREERQSRSTHKHWSI